MPDAFNGTLSGWQNFYFMAGGASATLLGLMFVALSMGTHLINDEVRQEIETFTSPSIFYFVSVLLLACLMLVPMISTVALGVLLLIGGASGLAWTAPRIRLLILAARKHQDFGVADWLAQIILPALTYPLVILAAICVADNAPSVAFGALWLATIWLLICAIYNTWSLVIWVIMQRKP
ncbi:MAG TPA: hypothetical protein VKQ72_02350 [Aggregatilineales bacterium]|nr:hypothetical protein [Aggregatilineales bacterium]